MKTNGSRRYAGTKLIFSGTAAKGSFRRQAILTFVVGFVLLVTAFTAYQVRTESAYLYRESTSETISIAESLAISSRSWVLANDVAGLQEVVHAFQAHSELHYAMVISPAGQVLAHTDATKIGQFVTDEQSLALIKSPPANRIMIDDEAVSDVAVPIKLEHRHVGWARIAQGREVITGYLHKMMLSSVLFVLVALTSSLLASVLIANRLGYRIGYLMRVAEEVQAGNYATRANIPGEDEIAKLANSLNHMLDVLARDDEELREASIYTRSLIEASLDPLVTISAEGKITDVNQATETATGRRRSELIGTDFSDYFTQPDKAREGYQQVFLKGSVTDYPLALRHRDGYVTDVLYNASVYRNEAGEVEGVFAAARDITERKQAEEAFFEAQQIFRTLVEDSPDIIARYDRDCRRTYVNPTYLKVAQMPREVLLESTPMQRSPLPVSSADILQKLLRKVLDTGVAEAVDIEWPMADNIDHWYNVYAFPEFDREGKVAGVMTISRDITERKRAENQVRAASLYTRSLIEASVDPLVTISAEGKITDVNRATENVTGSSRSELIGTDFSDYFTEPDKARKGYQQVFQKGFVTDYPLALRHRDGQVTDVLYNASVYHNEAGEVEGVFAAARDITEQKRAEAIRTQLAAIVESSNDAIIGKTTDGIIFSWNKGAERIYGYTADEIIGKPITTLAPPSRHAEIHEFLSRIRDGQTVANYESERIRKDGALIHVALTLSPISDVSGHITGISTIARDITEKKRLQEELREAVVYNRSLIEASMDPLVTISAEGKITDVNQATENVTGSSRSELIGTDFSDYFTEPDKAREGYQQVFAKGFVTDYPLALRHRDGHVTDVLYNASVYRNEAGEVSGVFAAARDVTERNKAEQEVAQLSLRNRLILDSMGEGIYGLDTEGCCTFANPAASELFGFGVEELLGQHCHTLFHHTKPDGSFYPVEECPVQAAYKQGVVHRGSDLYWRRDGSSFPVEFISTPIIEAGKITGAVVAFRDITERKLAEEQLRRSEYGLIEAQRLAHVGSWYMDLATNQVFWSEELYKMYGFDPALPPPLYTESMKLFTPESWERLSSSIAKAVETGISYELELETVNKDGVRGWMWARGELVRDADGKAVQVRGVVMDITRRKLDEQALRRLNRELRAISNCNQTLMRAEGEQALLDDICRIVCDDAGYRMAWVGYPENNEAKTIRPAAWAGVEDGYLEQAKLTWADTELGHGPSGVAIRSGESACVQDFSTDPQAAPWRDAALQRGYGSSISLPLKDKEKATTFGIFNIYSAIPHAFTQEEMRLLEELAGDLAFGIVVLRARIERDHAEKNLRELNERFSLATRAGRLGVWDWNLLKNELVWDDRMYELYGIKRADFRSAYAAWLKGVHPDDRAYSDEISLKAQRGEREYDTVFRVVWPDRSIHYLKAYGQVERDADGRPVRMTGVNYDITELKEAEDKVIELNHHLEARVAERTAQLEAANKELEAFSYSVSHDLRTPLRAIDGFSHILLEDYTDKLDDEGKRLLSVVRDNTIRMGQLIDDILKFSRTGRLEMNLSRIDMESMAHAVFEELQPSVDSSKLQLEIEHIPAAKGDSAMMRQVFVNLLSNAIKFTRNSTPARIKVGCSIVGNEAVYYVKDNGAGFDMQYANRLFGVFQRLHAVADFEGTGIGLAIVKRIITRHGGRVWAEGKVGEGATIYFALPAKEKEHG